MFWLPLKTCGLVLSLDRDPGPEAHVNVKRLYLYEQELLLLDI